MSAPELPDQWNPTVRAAHKPEDGGLLYMLLDEVNNILSPRSDEPQAPTLTHEELGVLWDRIAQTDTFKGRLFGTIDQDAGITLVIGEHDVDGWIITVDAGPEKWDAIAVHHAPDKTGMDVWTDPQRIWVVNGPPYFADSDDEWELVLEPYRPAGSAE
jgi:hypothetical protein